MHEMSLLGSVGRTSPGAGGTTWQRVVAAVALLVAADAGLNLWDSRHRGEVGVPDLFISPADRFQGQVGRRIPELAQLPNVVVKHVTPEVMPLPGAVMPKGGAPIIAGAATQFVTLPQGLSTNSGGGKQEDLPLLGAVAPQGGAPIIAGTAAQFVTLPQGLSPNSGGSGSSGSGGSSRSSNSQAYNDQGALPAADPGEVLRVWQGAVGKLGETDVRSLPDTCTGKTLTCSMREVGPAGYVFYLADILSPVTTTGNFGTFYDYAVAAVRRLSQVTDFPILLLVAQTTYEANPRLCARLRVAPNVFLTVVDDSFYLKPLERYGVRQVRGKLRHAYGTIQVFNPQYTGMLKRALFIDIDTFALQNTDEVFCSPRFGASERPPKPAAGKQKKGSAVRQPSGDYNGGVFLFHPSQDTYNRFIREMVQYMKQPGEKKFAMQHLLHTVYPGPYTCMPSFYNCFGIQQTGPVSPKCGVSNEADVLRDVKILHGKLSNPAFKSSLPQIHALWSQTKGETESHYSTVA